MSLKRQPSVPGGGLLLLTTQQICTRVLLSGSLDNFVHQSILLLQKLRIALRFQDWEKFTQAGSVVQRSVQQAQQLGRAVLG